MYICIFLTQLLSNPQYTKITKMGNYEIYLVGKVNL